MASSSSSSAAAAGVAGVAKIYFRPALFWQRVRPWHVADAGLEFRMNFSTRVNEARFPCSIKMPEARLAALRKEAARIVPDGEGRGDGAALEKRLCDAATWGGDVAELLRTCYVTRAVAVAALVEAAARGQLGAVRALLAAAGDSRKLAFELHPKYGKNALHAAAERGEEEVLAALVRCAGDAADVYGVREAAGGLTALGLLRARDMSGIARRVGALVRRMFPPAVRVRPAALEDAARIFQLVNRAYSVEIGDEGLAFKTTDRFDAIEEVREMIESFVLLVEEEEEEEEGGENIVAVSGVAAVHHDDGLLGTFGPFAVDAREQRRGLGAKLLAETEKRLRALGCTRVEIDVVNHRTDLFPFYAKHGYETSSAERKKEMFAEDNHKVTAQSVLTRPSHYVVLTKRLQ
jgi:GNAT superfamily N-acetyltransferase